MKKLILALAAAVSLVHAADGKLEWMTDAPKAIAKAKEDKKIVVLHFTGSDWCGFCIKQDKEVFSTDEFGKYAKANLVLVDLDFPNKKKLPDDLKKANEALKEKYGVKGFPTLVFLDAEGKEIGRKVGYGGGGPTAVIGEIKKAAGKS
ncbi:MAG: thioredoxin family protein [Limisphaerales bacterium]